MMTIELKGEPKSTQHCYKYACRGNFPAFYMTKEGKTIKESYQWQARAQYKGAPIDAPLVVTAYIYFGTKRRQDIDNFNKLFFDALSGIVWVDDSQVQELHLYKFYDKAEPRIDLKIQTL